MPSWHARFTSAAVRRSHLDPLRRKAIINYAALGKDLPHDSCAYVAHTGNATRSTTRLGQLHREDDAPRRTSVTGRGHAARKGRIERRLAAVLGTDIIGYSALIVRAEEDTYRRINAEVRPGVPRNRAGARRRIQLRRRWRAGGVSQRDQGAEMRVARPGRYGAAQRQVAVRPADHIPYRDQLGRDHGSGGSHAAARRSMSPRASRRSPSPVVLPVGGCVRAGSPNRRGTLRGDRLAATQEYPRPGHGLRRPRVRLLVMDRHAGAASTERPRSHGATRPAASIARRSRCCRSAPCRRTRSDSYFAEGMIDDIIRALSGLKDLLVISRSSTIGFARFASGSAPHRTRARRPLRVAWQPSPRRQCAADRRRAERSGRAAMSSRPTASMVSLPTCSTCRIGSRFAWRPPSLHSSVSVSSIRALCKHPDNMTAYDLTLQALDRFYRIDRSSIEQARELLQQAIAHDPAMPLAYSHMASLRMRSIGQGWSADEMADRTMAASAARMAIERDRNDALGLAIYGHLQSYLLKDYEVAQEFLERAMAAGPSCAWAWAYSGLTCGYLGDIATGHNPDRTRGATLADRRGQLLARALSVAGYYLGGRYEDADRVGSHVGGACRRQYLEAARPDRQSRRGRRDRRGAQDGTAPDAAGADVSPDNVPRTNAIARRGS